LQGNSLERSFHFPLHIPPSTPTHRAEKFITRQPEGSGLNNSLAQHKERKKVGDEDDFVVPVFVQSGTGQCVDKTQNIIDREKLTPFSPTYSGRTIRHKNVCDEDPKLTTSPALRLRQEVRCESEECPKVSGPSHSVKSRTDPSTREKIEGLAKKSNATHDQEYQDFPVTNSSSDDTDPYSQQEFRTRSPLVDTRFVESVRDVENGNGPHHLRSISHLREDNITPNEPDNGSEYLGDGTNISLQMGIVDKSDDVSETSMVDSISGFDISPDDVVGVIGQKHFWKARKAIVK
jgi:EARLY FLOWERING 3 protein